MPVTMRPHHDLVILKPRADLHAALHGIQVQGGNIISALFGEVRIDNPIHYRVDGKLNQFAFAEVMRIGTGNVTGQGQDIPRVKVGDIVGFDLGQVGHVLPDSGHYVTSWRNLLCRFDASAKLPQALMNFVLVEHDDALADRFVFQKYQKLVAPKTAGAAVKTNDRAKTRVGYDLGRVVSFGHGRYVRGTFEPTDAKVGDIVVFMPTNGVVDFSFQHGKLLRFVPWKECDGTLEGIDV